jgi:hypothetical protein
MSRFIVQPPKGGNTMPNTNTAGVEIAFEPSQRGMTTEHHTTYALTGTLATEEAITQAIDGMIDDLNKLRAKASELLKERLR